MVIRIGDVNLLNQTIFKHLTYTISNKMWKFKVRQVRILITRFNIFIRKFVIKQLPYIVDFGLIMTIYELPCFDLDESTPKFRTTQFFGTPSTAVFRRIYCQFALYDEFMFLYFVIHVYSCRLFTDFTRKKYIKFGNSLRLCA